MKKNLVILLAILFALSIAGTAFAAPVDTFSDVPAKHWAYDAVKKLAKAGIVEGYGDGTFRGDRTMTRYEMAQIIANAMTKVDKADAENKALINKLAADFAAELNSLGVRVGTLEAKTNIGWNFENRIRYSGNDANTITGTSGWDWCQRIMAAGNVNDKVYYGARFEISDKFGNKGGISTASSGGNVTAVGSDLTGKLEANRVFFGFRNVAGIDDIMIGRFGQNLFIGPGLLGGATGNFDGAKLTKKFSDAVTFKASVYDVLVVGTANGTTPNPSNQEHWVFDFDFKASPNLTLNAAYRNANSNPVAKSTDVGFRSKIGKLFFSGEYINTDLANQPNAKAYALQLTNGVHGYFYPSTNIVDVKKGHSDAFAVSYRKMDKSSVVGGTSVFASTTTFINPKLSDNDNIKGFFYTYQNVLSKGVVWTVEYQDLKSVSDISGSSYQDKTWNSSFQFFF